MKFTRPLKCGKPSVPDTPGLPHFNSPYCDGNLMSITLESSIRGLDKGANHRLRRPRPNKDVFPDIDGTLAPQSPPFPQGASTFSDPSNAPLTGHYHRLPAGTELPTSINVVADGLDVNPASNLPRTHHTILNTVEMAFERFADLFSNLPWEYGSKK